MSKHTPGPWVIEPWQSKVVTLQPQVLRAEKVNLIRPVDDKNYEHGAVGWVFGSRSEECLANGRLMAAAPELLALAEDLMTFDVSSFPNEQELAKSHVRLKRLARALVSRVRGQ